MITGSQEYKDYLANIVNSYNPPNVLVRIPANEPIYKIDLDTRVIEAPKSLGVEADHEAELIYFIMDRYYDGIDLSEFIGVIQFKNAHNEEYMYIIPAYDILSFHNKILFAWNIQSPVTKYGGTVQFACKFFKMDKVSGELLYELNTLVCKTKVLTGWANKDGVQHNYKKYTVDRILSDPGIQPLIDPNGTPVLDENGNPTFEITGYGIWSKIQEIYEANKEFNVYWHEV